MKQVPGREKCQGWEIGFGGMPFLVSRFSYYNLQATRLAMRCPLMLACAKSQEKVHETVRRSIANFYFMFRAGGLPV